MCRWRENLGQLTAEQQQAYLYRESQIRHTFEGTEHNSPSTSRFGFIA